MSAPRAALALLAAALAHAHAPAQEPPAQEPPAQEPPAQEPPAQAEAQVPLELRVNRSIALAVEYLRSRQASDGSFPFHQEAHPGGGTALGALALAVAGVRRSDPALVRAMALLAD